MLKRDKKILCKAARIIEKRGHCKNILFLRDDPIHGPVCAVGALNAAVHKNGSADWGPQRLDLRVSRITSELDELIGGSLVDWNNVARRRKAQVIAFFRRIGECR